jgi:hypothetical protein
MLQAERKQLGQRQNFVDWMDSVGHCKAPSLECVFFCCIACPCCALACTKMVQRGIPHESAECGIESFEAHRIPLQPVTSRATAVVRRRVVAKD